jgi:hypothetical protein
MKIVEIRAQEVRAAHSRTEGEHQHTETERDVAGHP